MPICRVFAVAVGDLEEGRRCTISNSPWQDVLVTMAIEGVRISAQDGDLGSVATAQARCRTPAARGEHRRAAKSESSPTSRGRCRRCLRPSRLTNGRSRAGAARA